MNIKAQNGMKIAVFYFSSTGNTQYVIELIKKVLEEKGAICDTISIPSKYNIDFSSYDLLGFASCVPLVFLQEELLAF